jgi:hypothetical protein
MDGTTCTMHVSRVLEDLEGEVPQRLPMMRTHLTIELWLSTAAAAIATAASDQRTDESRMS